MRHPRYPYDIIFEASCVDCNCVFPVIENLMAEVRCPSCQAKYRIAQANNRHKDQSGLESYHRSRFAAERKE